MFVADIIRFLDAYRLSCLRAAVWMEILDFCLFFERERQWIGHSFCVCSIGLIVWVLIAFGYCYLNLFVSSLCPSFDFSGLIPPRGIELDELFFGQ